MREYDKYTMETVETSNPIIGGNGSNIDFVTQIYIGRNAAFPPEPPMMDGPYLTVVCPTCKDSLVCNRRDEVPTSSIRCNCPGNVYLIKYEGVD